MIKKKIFILLIVFLSCFLGGKYTFKNLQMPDKAVSETKSRSAENTSLASSSTNGVTSTHIGKSTRAALLTNANSRKPKSRSGNGGKSPTQPAVPSEPEYTAEEERKMSPLDLGFVGGEVLVIFENDLRETQRKAIAREVSNTDGSKYEFVNANMFILGINEEDRVSEAIAKFNRHAGIRHIQKNFVYRPIQERASVNDPRFSEQWGWPTVNAEQAWKFLESAAATGYVKTRVAVLDTGMDMSHVDIQAAANKSLSIDVVGGANTPLTRDIDEHGSHVGGIIAATSNNGQGVAGIASGARNDIVDLVNVNVFQIFNGRPGADTADIVRGLNYAKEVNASVINMSLGTDVGAPYDLAYHIAVKDLVEAGTTIVVAHGNENKVGTAYPSGFPEVIAVVALDPFDVSNAINVNPKAWYSNYGTTAHISAPGSNILSLKPDGSGYQKLSGTSMASPLVAGVVAMMYSVNPSITPQEVRDILADTALDLNGEGYDIQTAYGCIDAFRAVQVASNKDLPGKVPVVNSVNILGASEVEVSWRFMRGAEKCEIYRAETATGAFTKIATVDTSLSQTSYNDTSVTHQRAYFYKIRFSRVNDSGTTEYSEFSTVTAVTIPKDGKRVYIYNADATGDALRAQGFLSLRDAVTAATSGQILELVTDVFLAETLTVAGKTLTVTAGTEAARTIKRDSRFVKAIFDIKDGGHVNFGKPDSTSASAEKTLILDGNIAVGASESMVVVRATGTANIYENARFTNAISAAYGAALTVRGTVTMHGGELSKNQVVDRDFSARGGAVVVYGPNGLFTMNGGVIKENSANASLFARGGGVYVTCAPEGANGESNGKFIMNGGEISGNKAISVQSAGGGVEIIGGIFEMTGGKISGNRVREDGVYDSGDHDGAGVDLYGWEDYGIKSKFVMSGGEISGNHDAGVTQSMTSDMYLSGTAKIMDNDGPGIDITSGYSDVAGTDNVLYMSGGEVKNNNGIGIYSMGGDTYPRGGRAVAKISGGTVSGNANGQVYVAFGGTCELSGGTIVNTGGNSWSNGLTLNAGKFYWSGGTLDNLRFYGSPIIVNGEGSDSLEIELADSFTDYTVAMVSYELPGASAETNAAKAAAGKSRFRVKSPSVGLRQKTSEPTKLEMDISVPATSVSISPAVAKIQVGDTLDLRGTVVPVTTTASPVWTSSNPAVASVSQTGIVTALSFGKATITLAYGAKKATAEVTVAVTSDSNIGIQFHIGKTAPASFDLPTLAQRDPYWNPFPIQPYSNVDFSDPRGANTDLAWFPQDWGTKQADFFTGELGVQNFSGELYENGTIDIDKSQLITWLSPIPANEVLPGNTSFTFLHDGTAGTTVNGILFALVTTYGTGENRRFGHASDISLVYSGEDSEGRHRVSLVIGSRPENFNAGKGVVAVHAFPQGIDPRDTFHNYAISYFHTNNTTGELDFFVDGERVTSQPIAYVNTTEKTFLSYGSRIGGEAAVAGNGLVPDFTEARGTGQKVRAMRIYNFAVTDFFAFQATSQMSGMRWRGGSNRWNAENVWYGASSSWNEIPALRQTFATKEIFESAHRGIMLRPAEDNVYDDTVTFDALNYEPDSLFVETDGQPKQYVLNGSSLTRTKKIGASYGYLILTDKLGGDDGFNGEIYAGYSGGILQYLPAKNGNAATTEQILNGRIGGETSITKTGAGILTLNAANNYTKGTQLSEGTLKIGNANALGTGVVYLQNGTKLDLSPLETALTVNSISVASGTSVTVNVGSRTFATKTTLIKWNAAPAGDFTLTGTNLPTGATLEKTQDGLLLTAPNLPEEPGIGNDRTATLTNATTAWSHIDWRDSAGQIVPVTAWTSGTTRATLTAETRAIATLDQNVTLGTLTLDGFSAIELSQESFAQLNANVVKISTDAQFIFTGSYEHTRALSMTKFQPAGSNDAGTIVFKGSVWTLLPDPSNIFPAAISLHNEKEDGIILPQSYIGTELSIANLSGSKNFRADYNDSRNVNITGNRFVSANQTRNTTFSGAFTSTSNGRKSALRVAASVTGATLTLSGQNTTTGTLEITATGRVNLTGTWAGPVTVAGTLLANGQTAPNTLILKNGATLDISARRDAYGTSSSTSVTVPAGATVTIAVGNRALTAGTVLLAWTSAPAGTFELSGNNLATGTTLSKTEAGLVVAGNAPPETPQLEVSPTLLQLANANAYSTRVTVTANNEWTATSSDTSWLTVTPASGTGTGSFTISVTENSGTESRSGTVTVRSGGLEKTVTVTQPADTVEPPVNPDFSLGFLQYTFANAGAAEQKITVTATADWTVASSEPWLTLSAEGGSGNDELTFSVDVNSGTEARTATIVFTDANGETHTVTVTQPAVKGATGSITLFPQSAEEVSAENTNFTRKLICNGRWIAESQVDWLTISPDSGYDTPASGTMLQIEVAANPSTSPRTGTIRITFPNSNFGSKLITVNQAAGDASSAEPKIEFKDEIPNEVEKEFFREHFKTAPDVATLPKKIRIRGERDALKLATPAEIAEAARLLNVKPIFRNDNGLQTIATVSYEFKIAAFKPLLENGKIGLSVAIDKGLSDVAGINGDLIIETSNDLKTWQEQRLTVQPTFEKEGVRSTSSINIDIQETIRFYKVKVR